MSRGSGKKVVSTLKTKKEKNSIAFPIKNLDGDDFVLLNHYSDSWDFRAYDISKQRERKEPSGHRLREVRGTGGVKCHPRKIPFDEVLKD